MNGTVPTPTKIWYGVGQAAEGLKNESYTLFLLFYYTQVVGLSGFLSGQAIMIALLFDAITDPFAGALSDRMQSRFGRRHPFLYASALPVSVFFYLTFAPPEGLGQGGLFLWLAVFAVLTRFSMTLFHVPHLALGAELSTDYQERTSIVTIQMVLTRIGHAVAGTLGLLVFMRPTDAFPNGQLNPGAYPPFALTMSLLMFSLIVLSAAKTHWCIPQLPQADADSAREPIFRSMLGGMREALKLRSFQALFWGTLVTYVAWGIAVSLGLHMGTYFWRVSTADLFIWGVASGTGIFTGLGYWRGQAYRLDKKVVFIRGMKIFTLFTVIPIFLKIAGFWPGLSSSFYLPLYVFTTGLVANFGIAAPMVTARSMMADITDEDQLVHGRRREGVFFGAISFAAKAFFGIGSLVAGIVVDAVGLAPGAAPESVAEAVVHNLGYASGCAIAILVGASLWIFGRYDLTRERHAHVRAELDARLASESL